MLELRCCDGGVLHHDDLVPLEDSAPAWCRARTRAREQVNNDDARTWRQHRTPETSAPRPSIVVHPTCAAHLWLGRVPRVCCGMAAAWPRGWRVAAGVVGSTGGGCFRGRAGGAGREADRKQEDLREQAHAFGASGPDGSVVPDHAGFAAPPLVRALLPVLLLARAAAVARLFAQRAAAQRRPGGGGRGVAEGAHCRQRVCPWVRHRCARVQRGGAFDQVLTRRGRGCTLGHAGRCRAGQQV